jgi:hypothetical protein
MFRKIIESSGPLERNAGIHSQESCFLIFRWRMGMGSPCWSGYAGSVSEGDSSFSFWAASTKSKASIDPIPSAQIHFLRNLEIQKSSASSSGPFIIIGFSGIARRLRRHNGGTTASRFCKGLSLRFPWRYSPSKHNSHPRR